MSSGEGYSPATMLADAIGRVAVLEHAKTQLSSDVSELGATIATVSSSVERIESALDKFMADMSDEDDSEDEAVLVDWSSLDADAARLEWSRLENWLDQWLIPTYELTLGELPPCWMHHPAMREELSWLRSAWAGAYRTGRGSGVNAGEWHVRWLPAAIERIKGHAHRAGCSIAGKHRGELLSESARHLSEALPASSLYWDTEGREVDIANRPVSQIREDQG